MLSNITTGVTINMLKTDDHRYTLKMLGEETSLKWFIVFPISSFFSGGRGEGGEGEEYTGRVRQREEKISLEKLNHLQTSRKFVKSL